MAGVGQASPGAGRCHSRVQATADAQEICVTDEVIADPGVRDLLVSYPTERGSAEFRGVGRRMGVVRVGGAATA